MIGPATIRVLTDPPLDGPTNMARDEALMLLVGRSLAPPTLRLYQWAPPTISLGYFQHHADCAALPAPAGELPVVRRLTGGGAILHDRELTYSLALPVGHALVAGRPNRLYELAHDAVIASLAELGLSTARGGETDDSGAARGPFFCFARRHCYDVLLGADKLAGSAQRRTRDAVLQHGSIVLGSRFEQQPTAHAPLRYEDAMAALPSVFVGSLGSVTGEVFASGEWSDDERSETATLRAKYASDAWTRRT